MIVFDQRGTGYSEPNLRCAALVELVYDQFDDTSPNAVQVEAQQRQLADCRDDWSDGGGPQPSTTRSPAPPTSPTSPGRLGYERWNLLGVSYGTRLAQTVLRTHPEGIRSVILDSVYPVAVDSLVELPDQMQAAFDHFFAACRVDPACDGRYPNLEARFAALVERLGAEPADGDRHRLRERRRARGGR